MKHLTKRSISLLLTLAMLLSVLTGTVFGAGSTTNTGTRHELCEYLSPDAVAYYKGSNNWDSLSALSGKDTQSSVDACGTPLFNALHNLMWNTLTTTVTYKSLTSYWKTTDASGGSKDACLIYADAISSSYNREHVWPKSHGNFYESGAGSDLHHLRPSDSTINSTRGHWTYGNVKQLCSSYNTKDYNGKTVLWYNTSYSGNNCLGLVEIKDDVKGDIARILLYVYVTYGKASGENLNLFTKTSSSGSGNNANTGDKIIYDRDTLLQWCENDPVDTWEMSRNDCCANVQGNRNVFIDYPEFAWLLFDQEVPDMDTPSGMAHEMQGGTSYSITAVSSNEMMGTVSGSGRSYTAYPAEGYYVSGYTLVPSNAATVTQTGNSFTLSKPTADCTLTVSFAAKAPATLSFSVPAGVSCASLNAYAGDDVTLPTPSGKPTGEYEYTFKGWVASTYDNVTEKPAVIYPAGSAYTLNGSAKLYALYTYSVGGTGSSTEFTRITTQDELTDGSYVFTSSATGKAMKTDVGSNWVYPGGTYTGDTIDNPAETDIWTYTDGKISCADGALTCSSAKSISLSDEGTPWTVTASSGVWTLVSNGNTMSFNNTGWRPYGSGGYGNDKTFFLYKGGSGGTTFYTTVIGAAPECEHLHVSQEHEDATCTQPGYNRVVCDECLEILSETPIPALGHLWDDGVISIPATATTDGLMLFTCTRKGCGATRTEIIPASGEEVCKHENTELRDQKDATCTENGYTGDTYCLDCKELLLEGEIIPMLGHDYKDTVIAPTCTEDGYTLHVCSRCTDSCQDTPTDALGHDFVDGICSRCGEEDPDVPPVHICPCDDYDDLYKTQWYHEGVDYALDNGLMNGMGDRIFNPDGSLTRAMLVTILYRLEKGPSVEGMSNPFTDVPENQWYTEAVIWAADQGIVNGMTETTYAPNDNITREQIATILYRYAGKPAGSGDLNGFADASSVSPYALDAMAWAVGEGIIGGMDGKLAPKDNATRAQIATILYRYLTK